MNRGIGIEPQFLHKMFKGTKDYRNDNKLHHDIERDRYERGFIDKKRNNFLI